MISKDTKFYCYKIIRLLFCFKRKKFHKNTKDL